MVNLDLYKVFYVVAKCGSLTKAAEELYISQPAVSQAIKQLEMQLGGKLFHRVARGMELTETGGRQMFEVVSKVMAMLDEAENAFSDLKTTATGTVKIGAADNVITHFLMKYIKEYHENNPNVSLSFFNGNTKEVLESVKNNKTDVGFVNLPIDYPGVVFTRQTCKIHDIFVANSKFSELFTQILPLNALSNYPLIMLDNTTMTRKEIDGFMAEQNIKLLPEFELMSVELLVALAKNGLGIACVPREYVLEELESGQLTEIKTTPALPTRAIGVVINKDKSFTYALNEFLKLLSKHEKTE